MKSPILLVFLWVLASFPLAARSQPTLPAEAEKLSGDQIRQHLGDRTFRFVVYDAKGELSGTSTWDMKSESASGDYVWEGKSGQWKKQWRIVDNKNCSRDGNSNPWECQNIYVLGDTHYEVRDDGIIHGVNTLLAK